MKQSPKISLENFLVFIHGLKERVLSYELQTNKTAIFFYFEFRGKNYGIWFAHDYYGVGIRIEGKGIVTQKTCHYNEQGKYIDSGFNIDELNIAMQNGFVNPNYESFLGKLESSIID